MTIVRLNPSGIIYPISVAQGSTGTNSFIANGLIIGGANAGDPLSTLGPGSLDQYFESNGPSSIATAKNQNQLGGLRLINTYTISSSTPTLDVLNLSTNFTQYILRVSALVPVTTNTALTMLMSSNNGTSWDNSAGNYSFQWSAYRDSSTANSNGGASSTSATAITICTAVSNTVFANDFTIILDNPALSQYGTGPRFFGKYKNNSSECRYVRGYGFRLANQVNNAFQLKFSSGNIAQAYAKLYARVAP